MNWRLLLLVFACSVLFFGAVFGFVWLGACIASTSLPTWQGGALWLALTLMLSVFYTLASERNWL